MGQRGWRAGAAIAAAIVIGACGAGQPSEELRAQIDMIEEAGASGIDDDLTDEHWDCIVDGINDRGLDLNGLGTADGQTALAEVRYGCVPDLHELESYLEGMSKVFGLAAGIEPEPAQTKCILDAVWERSPDPARSMAVGDVPGDGDRMMEIMLECLPEGFFDESLEANPAELGDDPLTDELYSACGEGDGVACELLLLESAPGSALEEFAVDCGGRGEPAPGEGCAAGLHFDEDGFLREDSPAVSGLIERCQAGDLLACDFLFQASPFDSHIEEVGFTCGGRLATGAIPSCRARLG